MTRTGIFLVALMASSISGESLAAVQALSDDAMSEVTGQSLFLSDLITPNSLPGAGGSGSTTDFSFYRVGLDTRLDMNMNLKQMRLGCGGVNDAINANVCDIDLTDVRFMGTGSGQTSPDGKTINGVGSPVTSDFQMYRPYLEIAIKNDATRTQREVAGILIGAQKVNGYVGIGAYNGGDGSSDTGAKAISGYMAATVSADVKFTSGLGNGTACLGNPSVDSACSGVAPYTAPADRTTGTRITTLQLPDAPLSNLHGAGGLLSLFSGSSMYANLTTPLTSLHGFALNNTPNFFLSFEREPVSWPTYDKTGYSVTANTGWWMNVPSVEMLNLQPPTQNLGCPGFLCIGLLSAFGSPGLSITVNDMGSRPPKNCYGQTAFC